MSFRFEEFKLGRDQVFIEPESDSALNYFVSGIDSGIWVVERFIQKKKITIGIIVYNTISHTLGLVWAAPENNQSKHVAIMNILFSLVISNNLSSLNENGTVYRLIRGKTSLVSMNFPFELKRGNFLPLYDNFYMVKKEMDMDVLSKFVLVKTELEHQDR